MAVVDASLKVRGLAGLRVVDASVMPTLGGRKHQRADHHDRRKGRRHDPRPRGAGARSMSSSRATSGRWPPLESLEGERRARARLQPAVAGGGLGVALIAAHAARVLLACPPDPFALTRSGPARRAVPQLFTYMFVHGNWAHVLLNTLFCVAFGAPVARWLGNGAGAAWPSSPSSWPAASSRVWATPAGSTSRHAFGRTPSDWALVGASGAASGLMGAAARLIEGERTVGLRSPAARGRHGRGLGRGQRGARLSGLTPGAAGAAGGLGGAHHRLLRRCGC